MWIIATAIIIALVVWWAMFAFIDFDGEIFGGVAAAIIVIIGILIVLFRADNKNEQRLMAQCMADGHKEYECVAALRRNESTPVFIPFVIPSGR